MIASTLAALLTTACGESSEPASLPVGGAINKVTTKPRVGVQGPKVAPKVAPRIAPTLDAKPITKPGVRAPIGVVKPIELAPGRINGASCGASCSGNCGEPDEPESRQLGATPGGSAATIVNPTPTPKLAPTPAAPITPALPPNPAPVLPPKPIK